MKSTPCVNVANIDLLIEAIEGDDDFDMKEPLHECGSPSCVCGWALYLAGLDLEAEKKAEIRRRGRSRSPNWQGIRDAAFIHAGAQFMGIDFHDAGAIYYQTARDKDEVLAMLRRLRVTGRVEWA